MNASDYAKRLTKTNSFIFLGQSRVAITKCKEDIFQAFPDLKDDSLADLTMGQYKKLCEDIFKAIPQKGIVPLTEDAQSYLEVAENRFTLFADRHDHRLFHYFDKIDREIVNMDSKVLLNRFKEDARKAIVYNTHIGEFVFDPYSVEPYTEKFKHGLKMYDLNLFQPQAWLKKYPTGTEFKAELPALLRKYIDHLIPKKKEQKLFLDWIANALTSKNQTILSLRGARGNGKTIIMKVIMAIVGYHILARDGFFDDNFNAEFKNKLIIGFDDDSGIGTQRGNTFRKAITNGKITFNEKFKQTTGSERFFASLICCSNLAEKFYLKHDERKLISITLTTKDANEVFTDKELNFLDQLLKDNVDDYKEDELKFLAQAGHFFRKRALEEETISPTYCYLGGHAWDDIVESLPSFTKFIVKRVLAKVDEPIICYKDLATEYQGAMGGRGNLSFFENLAPFFDEFKHDKDKIILESRALPDGDGEFIVNQKFVNSKDISLEDL